VTSTGRATKVAADSQGTIYIIGMDGNVYHLNSSGTGWDRLIGGSNTFVANGGSMLVWAVGAVSGGNSIYRFSDTGLSHTRTIHGYWNLRQWSMRRDHPLCTSTGRLWN